MRGEKTIRERLEEMVWSIGVKILVFRSGSRGQAAIEYVLMLVVLSVFGQWLVKYFIEVLEEGTFTLSGNLTYYLHTGTGWP